MEMKRKSAVGIATEGHAQALLRRGPARNLGTEEDKVLRMRLGASPPAHAALARSAEVGSELAIELLAAEIEVHLRWKARHEEGEVARRPASPQPSRAKEKIVRVLRRKA
jgi:hypothetical protein